MNKRNRAAMLDGDDDSEDDVSLLFREFHINYESLLKKIISFLFISATTNWICVS